MKPAVLCRRLPCSLSPPALPRSTVQYSVSTRSVRMHCGSPELSTQCGVVVRTEERLVNRHEHDLHLCQQAVPRVYKVVELEPPGSHVASVRCVALRCQLSERRVAHVLSIRFRYPPHVRYSPLQHFCQPLRDAMAAFQPPNFGVLATVAAPVSAAMRRAATSVKWFSIIYCNKQ